jgi:hypothetical protein
MLKQYFRQILETLCVSMMYPWSQHNVSDVEPFKPATADCKVAELESNVIHLFYSPAASSDSRLLFHADAFFLCNLRTKSHCHG